MDSSDHPANRDSANPRSNRGQPAVGREPMLLPSPDVLLRYNARVLDPTTAWRRFPDEVIRPTVYVGNRLLLRNVVPGSGRFQALEDAAAAHGLSVVPVVADQRHADALASFGGRSAVNAYPQRVELKPQESPAIPADAWPVLQSYRSLVGEAQVPQDVALEHLLTATVGPGIGGLPFAGGHGVDGVPFAGGHAVGPASQYGMPGWGGRVPVNWIGPEPVRPANFSGRRPVVAVLDTGAGSHPWLRKKIVKRYQTVDGSPGGHPLGLTDPTTDPENTGILDDIYEGVLDSDAGHGTFIAGIIRQLCPDADILAIRVMSSDGVVAEGDLLNSITAVLQRQTLAQDSGRPDLAIDVVSLSLGYYHEQPDDAAFDPMLLAPLTELGARGVAVVASAGNDATARQMFPAAFTPYPGGLVSKPDPNVVPLISVGALNPNWRTIALFSNGGSWVRCYRPGASIVSTIPTTFNASAQPSAVVDIPGEGVRATIDPDDFTGGFATWSGTSFSAPYLAGEIAAAVLSGKYGALDPVDAESAITRGWGALGGLLGMTP